MTQHVSVDLAKRLQAAGLKWEPEVGDWVWVGASSGPCLVIDTNPEDAGEPGWVRVWNPRQEGEHNERIRADAYFWLPTGQQCQEVLAAMGQGPDVWYAPLSRQWHCQTPNEHEKHQHPAEAAGLALLAALETKKEATR